MFASIVPAALNAEEEVSNAEEEEIGRRGEESLVGRDVLGTPIASSASPRLSNLRANTSLTGISPNPCNPWNPWLNTLGPRRPPVSLSSARSRPARSSRNVLLLRAN